jgi:rhodanese-related sulfurtransferase
MKQKSYDKKIYIYCISSYSFRRNYPFFEFENPKVTVYKAKGHRTQMCGNYLREENYSRAETI